MPAPTGNTNAVKWTLEATLDTLKKVEFYAGESTILTLGSALTLSGTHSGAWTLWKKKWKDDHEIMDRMCFIEQVFVNKLIDGALCKRLHAGMCMFALRVNYRMRDQKDGEKEVEETLPAHLAGELPAPEPVIEVAPPLPDKYAALPHIFTNEPPADGNPYREVYKHVYTIHSEQYCAQELRRLRKWQEEHGCWKNWVLPPLESDPVAMQRAA